MGAVVSCAETSLLNLNHRPQIPDFSPLTCHQSQIESLFQTLGSCLMAIVNGIGSVLQAIIAGIVSCFDIIISCLTCGRGGGRRRGGRSAV
ncbi:hypothetical protein HO133_004008 [Letharia lupina]|uniref:Uncharacterized protein n=1 Tax=Letharia lupina TaxID=560253 RepID=A0A8H6C9X8_9LECA|nr:uncharacterized protein HO133_004008 [Letharia lupina]KAF6219539.1 hypothetical protein HO133_004008 [Letharia lupina]